MIVLEVEARRLSGFRNRCLGPKGRKPRSGAEAEASPRRTTAGSTFTAPKTVSGHPECSNAVFTGPAPATPKACW